MSLKNMFLDSNFKKIVNKGTNENVQILGID